MTDPDSYYTPGRTYLSAAPRGETVTTPSTTASTPEPVRHAAAVYGSLAAFAVTALGVLVAVGALTTDQAESINGLVEYVGSNFVPVASAIVGFTSLLSGVAGAWATAEAGRRKVTPVAPAPLVVEGTENPAGL